MITFKIGILGAGKIAGTIADTLNQLDGFEPYAVASRDINKANEFADTYHIEKRYGSYEDLVNDPDIDLVYIATPHSHHAEQAKMCINAGKPVFVEKPLSYNAQTAMEVIKLAQEKKVFCGEAMWLRYSPMMKITCDMLKDNMIGEPRLVTANLGYDLRTVDRLTNPELAGGALLDLGVYPLTAILMIMRSGPVSMGASCSRLSTGVDAIDTIQLNFPNGRMATAYASMMYNSDNTCKIYGTKGRIEIDEINNPTAIRVYDNNNDLVQELHPAERQISGYEYEFIAARNAIICGNLEPEEMKHQDTLNLLGMCDALRKSWKITYPLPGEPEPENVTETKNV